MTKRGEYPTEVPPFRLGVRCLLIVLAIVVLSSVGAARELRSPNGVAEQVFTGDDFRWTDFEDQGNKDNQQQPDNQKPATTRPRENFVKQVLADQKTIWLSPFHAKPKDLRWIAPLVAATTVLILTDSESTEHLNKSQELADNSRRVSRIGAPWATFGTAGALFGIGVLTKNERVRETGVLGIQALINSSIVEGAIKFAAGRERPNRSNGRGHFFEGGQSFPSGHATTIWALATVIAEEYSDKPWIKISAYSAAAAVSMARFTGRSHFTSDVLAGSALGYLIGRYTVRAHSSRTGIHPSAVITPYLNRSARAYGVQATLSF